MEKRIFLVAAFLEFLAFPHSQDCISQVERNFWKNTLIRACNVNRVHSAQRIGLWALVWPCPQEPLTLQNYKGVALWRVTPGLSLGEAIFFLTLFIFLRNDDDE